jgi:hypothetical protein
MNINYASENEVISSDPIKLAAFKIAVESQAI